MAGLSCSATTKVRLAVSGSKLGSDLTSRRNASKESASIGASESARGVGMTPRPTAAGTKSLSSKTRRSRPSLADMAGWVMPRPRAARVMLPSRSSASNASSSGISSWARGSSINGISAPKGCRGQTLSGRGAGTRFGSCGLERSQRASPLRMKRRGSAVQERGKARQYQSTGRRTHVGSSLECSGVVLFRTSAAHTTFVIFAWTVTMRSHRAW